MPHSIEALIDRQFRRWEHELKRGSGGAAAPAAAMSPTLSAPPEPVVTLSRQHGTHGADVAASLAERLGYTLLHRDVIDRIAESTGYTRRLLESLDEHSRSGVTLWVESMLSGRYLDEHDYVVGLLKTIRSIAALGGVVVVGRGANFIVGAGHGLHVRIVAPRDLRVRQLMERRRLTESAAAHEIDTVDHERRSFVRRMFAHSIDDTLAYDLVVNEAGRSIEDMAALVLAAAGPRLGRHRRPPLAHAS